MSSLAFKDDLDPVAWIEQHQAGVWRYLRLLGCPVDLAADLVQESFLAALARGSGIRWDQPRQASAWLRTTARNLYFMHLRTCRRAPRQLSVSQVDPGQVDLEAADAVFARHATDGGDGYRDALRQCLQQLEGRALRALDLRYGEGASRPEMAAALGMSEEGVKSLLQRVRRRLRECVEQRRQNHG